MVNMAEIEKGGISKEVSIKELAEKLGINSGGLPDLTPGPRS